MFCYTTDLVVEECCPRRFLHFGLTGVLMTADSQPPAVDRATLFEEFPSATYEQWLEQAKASLKGAPFEKKLVTQTYEGIALQPIYVAESREGLTQQSNLPGFPPFVRGAKPEGYLASPWDICQELQTSDPAEFNADARHDLRLGQTALGVVLQRPSSRGLRLDGLSDFRTAFSGIALGDVPLHLSAGATSLPFLALLMEHLEGAGIPADRLRGCIGADPLGELAREGALPAALEACYDLMAATARWCADRAPALQTVLVQGCPYHDAGASATQELAFALATAVEYVRALQSRGVPLDQILRQTRFSFSLGSSFFMEVAKLRAARVLWTHVVQAFGGNAGQAPLHLHGRTSAWNQSRLDSAVNMLRNTTEAFSGIVGGVNSLQVRPHDEPVGPPTEFSRRVARNVQLLLLHESHLTHPIDPAGGSWYVETLTDQVGRTSWSLFQDIEKQGGMARALAQGTPQQLVAEVAERKARDLETRRLVFVGVNAYPDPREPENLEASTAPAPDASRQAAPSSTERRQVPPGQLLRSEDLPGLLAALHHSAAEEKEELVSRAMAAGKAGARLSELTQALLSAAPTDLRITPLAIHRGPEPYERLREAAARHRARRGRPLTVFLAKLGELGEYLPRAEFSTTFFQVGGFEVLESPAANDEDDAAQAALASGAPLVVLCSGDQRYPTLVPALTRRLKAQRPDIIVVLAGRPAADQVEAYREAGLDDAIHIGANVLGILRKLQRKLGVDDVSSQA